MYLFHKFAPVLGLAAVAAMSLGAAHSAQASKVAVIASEETVLLGDVQTKLMSTGFFSGVDVYDVRPYAGGAPTLTTLTQYDSVLFFTDYVLDDPSGLGDTLDAYARSGHGVVDATFAHINNGSFSLGGAWEANGNASLLHGDSTFRHGDTSHGSNLTLVKNDAGSPLLNGVNSFRGGLASYHTLSGVNPNSTLVASWSNGDALVAYQSLGSGREVSLNFYPVSSTIDSYLDTATKDPFFWDANTDGARLMGNALQFSAGIAPAAVPEPSSVAAFAIAGLGLGALMLRSRKRKAAA